MRKGKWVLKKTDYDYHWECSICGTPNEISLPLIIEYEPPYPHINYCSRCGAKMRDIKKGE